MHDIQACACDRMVYRYISKWLVYRNVTDCDESLSPVDVASHEMGLEKRNGEEAPIRWFHAVVLRLITQALRGFLACSARVVSSATNDRIGQHMTACAV